jgi:hypothetical protein
MSLKHLRAMRGYRPTRKKDQAATNFLWILAERAGSGGRYKNGHQSRLGWTNFLSDEKLMEQLGTERQETCRQLRRRFRACGAIQTERKHTGKSRWPVYRYFLDLDWLQAQDGPKASVERSKPSGVERAPDRALNARQNPGERALNADLTRYPSDILAPQDGAGSGVVRVGEGVPSPIPSHPVSDQEQIQDLGSQEILSPEEIDDLYGTLIVSCPVLATEGAAPPVTPASTNRLTGPPPAAAAWLRGYAAEALGHGMKKWELKAMLQFLSFSSLKSRATSLDALDAAFRRRLRSAFKTYVEKGEARDGDSDRVVSYIERQWEARLQASERGLLCSRCGLPLRIDGESVACPRCGDFEPGIAGQQDVDAAEKAYLQGEIDMDDKAQGNKRFEIEIEEVESDEADKQVGTGIPRFEIEIEEA